MGGLLGSIGDFAKGVGEGAWDGVTGMAEGVGALAKGGYNLATSADARQQAWEAALKDADAAGRFAETAVTDPGKAAAQVGDAVNSTWDRVSSSYQQAAADGHGAEFIGKAFGQGAVLLGTAFVPGGAEAEAVGALGNAGRVAEVAGDLGKAGEVAGDAGKVADVTANAAAVTDISRVGDAGETSGRYLFRGDARPPEQIFQEGFQPRGTNTDLQDYAMNNTPSVYVGTSKSESAATEFATNDGQRDGFVYTTIPKTSGVDVNQALGAGSPFPWEQEVVFPGGLAPDEIRGVTPVSADGQLADHSLLNPNFKP